MKAHSLGSETETLKTSSICGFSGENQFSDFGRFKSFCIDRIHPDLNAFIHSFIDPHLSSFQQKINIHFKNRICRDTFIYIVLCNQRKFLRIEKWLLASFLYFYLYCFSHSKNMHSVVFLVKLGYVWLGIIWSLS